MRDLQNWLEKKKHVERKQNENMGLYKFVAMEKLTEKYLVIKKQLFVNTLLYYTLDKLDILFLVQR